jgi:peptidoglycan/xylan/chitin deacetylase (PgdA/CDA1 family)
VIPYSGQVSKCAALLFSGGISSQTAANMAALQGVNALATFYISASTIVSNTQTNVISTMAAAGMQIGHSGFTYASMTAMSASDAAITLLRNDKQFYSIFSSSTTSLKSRTPTSLLPPIGFNSDVCVQAQALGYNITQYDVVFDASGGDPIGAFNNSINALVASGITSPIIAMNDADAAVTQYIPQIVTILKNLGMTASTLGTCLNDPAPYRPCKALSRIFQNSTTF